MPTTEAIQRWLDTPPPPGIRAGAPLDVDGEDFADGDDDRECDRYERDVLGL